MTFREGCEAYIVSCRQRNLREGTINHYRQSYTQFYKYFAPDMPLDGFNLSLYDGFILHLRDTLDNDVSINSYLRDLKTTLRFLMNEGYVHEFKMRTVKADQQAIETYTDEELSRLLKKPDLKTCSFVHYQSWVMTNFLFSTGVRQHSLINICVNDVDFDNRVVTVRVTKNRKVLIVPLNQTMVGILREFLKHRQHEGGEDYLFCNTFGRNFLLILLPHDLRLAAADQLYIILRRADGRLGQHGSAADVLQLMGIRAGGHEETVVRCQAVCLVAVIVMAGIAVEYLDAIHGVRHRGIVGIVAIGMSMDQHNPVRLRDIV
ncbi:MAG: tyrosine-type recombinase/integrase [Clostridia bacterium]|nr:tyrosine-type recombinase/integrase [Clostridia bacterium]